MARTLAARSRAPFVSAALATLAVAGSMSWSGAAIAGGFEVPDYGARSVGRGGAYAVGAKDLTAIRHNPALLSKMRGTRLMISNNLVYSAMEYDRAPITLGTGSAMSTGAVRDQRPVFPLAGFFMAASSDFGLKNWTFALSGNGPSAVGWHKYPQYGPQSFMLTHLDVVVLFINASAAWRYREVFGIGATVQYAMMPKLEYGLVVDASTLAGSNASHYPLDAASPAMASSVTVDNVLKLKDMASGTAILGMWFRPIRAVEFGAAARVIPVYFNAKGGVTLDANVPTENAKASLAITLPAEFRTGVRYIHERGGREVFDVEMNYQMEAWSILDEYYMDFSDDSTINGQLVSDIRVTKNWRNTHSIRLGGDVNLLDDHLSLRMGGMIETGATPPGYAHLDFPSFLRGGPSVGITGSGGGFSATIGYMHLFQQTQEISNADARTYALRPVRPCPDNCTFPDSNGVPQAFNGVPANAGTFRSSFDIFSLMLEINASEMHALRLERKRKRRGGDPEGLPSGAPVETDAATTTPPTTAPETSQEPSAAEDADTAEDAVTAEGGGDDGSEPKDDAGTDDPAPPTEPSAADPTPP